MKGEFRKGDRVAALASENATCGDGKVVKVTTNRDGVIVYTVRWDDGHVLHPYHAYELVKL